MPERIKMVLIGVLVGGIWGAVLAGLGSLAGSSVNAAAAAYSIMTCAMIGGGIAALFGAFRVAKRGERVTPKSPYRKYKKKGG